jgi:hypothetical protein
MSTTNGIKEKITEYLTGEFPKFPIVVCESPEDSMTLWVQVFCVTPDQKELVKKKIFDTQEKLFSNFEMILLPMVKSLAITEQYYPEYLPKDPIVNLAEDASVFFDKIDACSSKWLVSSVSCNCILEDFSTLNLKPLLTMNCNSDAVIMPTERNKPLIMENEDKFQFAA